jgi:hypothetical protein
MSPMFILQLIYEHGEPMISTEETPDPSTRALWQSSFILQKRFLYSIKPFNMGPTASSPPKEDVLYIFIALENPSPQLGLNLQTMGTMANTLTI